MSHREMEFEELLFYVVELKDKLNAKLDAQTAKINHQGSIINQQGQIVDELCWQLRELSEKMRELRVENRRLQERLGRMCPECAGCHCGTYANHIADRYNELVVDDGKRKKSTNSDKSVKSDEQGQLVQSEVDQRRQTFTKEKEYSQVDKKRDGSSKKKWLFGGSDKKDTASAPIASSTTTWYIDDGIIYEPIELSAKPTTRATLEKISAEVSSNAPQPAPRRLYTAPAVDNLSKYFQDDLSDIQLEEIEEEDEQQDEDDVVLRPSHVKQFAPESQRGSSKVACSRIADLDLSYLPEEQSISTENIVRFTFSSRPATAIPATTSEDRPQSTSDSRRHAIRSYM